MTSLPSRLHPIYTIEFLTERDKDSDHRIWGCVLSLSIVTAILRGDAEIAGEILTTLPKDQLNKVG